jgi:hypothetical protein
MQRSSSFAAALGLGVGRAAKPAKRLGCLAHRVCDIVVGIAGKRYGFAGLRLLDARGREGDGLHIDVRLVHLRNSVRAEVQQVLDQPGGEPSGCLGSLFQITSRTFQKSRRCIVFFCVIVRIMLPML